MPATELATLRAARNRTILPVEKPDSPTAELRSIDEERWDIKDAIRGHERNSDHLPSLRRIGPFGLPTNGRCAARQAADRRAARLANRRAEILCCQALMGRGRQSRDRRRE